ncbi:MAG: M2 family metallopeptidase [Woeseiaceae bacterium]|nr:M2 family metallopeptidase [Woeseiaceae bacterium]
MRKLEKLVPALLFALWLPACSDDPAPADAEAPAAPAESADAFVARINAETRDMWLENAAAGWVYATYINQDTALLQQRANERSAAWHTRAVKQSMRYDGTAMSPETERAIRMLRLGNPLPAPDDPARRKELTGLQTEMEGIYGAGEYCRSDTECYSGNQLESLMRERRDYDELLEFWVGWREVAKPMRNMYSRYVELANEGAREIGFEDLGALWRSGYDMSEAEFRAETLRLWEQVEPFYEALQCHVRAKLGEHYGTDRVPQDGPIPAHLLGNMWAQSWGYVYELVEPYPGGSDLDVDGALKKKGYSPQEMVRSAESFYVSLGLPRLPDTFWERSLFVEPTDRKVSCHASAWTMDMEEDLRIKMCIVPEFEKLRTIYHELGHNYYQWAYNHQPPLFQDGAHSGFHEAIGDTVLLSMTPGYLAEVGLVGSAEQSEKDTINNQMKVALDRVAFLPFSKLIDEWRWGVFSGEITPDNYNAAWWALRERYQGVAAPVERTEADFDPGAKYHIPANVSYTRYFLARVMQFQMHRALCDAAGYEGPLHECSVYGSKEAGDRLWAMLEEGASQPWPDTLEKLTGTRQMDATAIIDYFAPLMSWLEDQNEGRSCGW